MFEITSDDIERLDDEDLRALVGLLCEAEVRRSGFSARSVTWGGDQNAADGGLDVRVSLPNGAAIDGFVPRPATGFQAKTQDMPRAEILGEMRPEGTLRPVIRDLAHRSGAYIIVSSKGSTSEGPLQNRRVAMKEAVKDLPNAASLTVDFYDRGRLATWVRDHAGLSLWVREKIGRPLHGWRAYGAWAYDPAGAGGEYLLDKKLRILTDAEGEDSQLQPAEGIKTIRHRLHKPLSIVRLVGLSGVGKTRFVQALFDHRLGEDSLDPSTACYTNIADKPDPAPIDIACELIAMKKRAILVIDNCRPEQHARLAEICRAEGSMLSLITLEHDIRDDQPEGTEVFHLKPSSADLIIRLLRTRFAQISAVDAQTIADLSDGNARVAIALAGTIGRNETIATLSDQDLFKRLFDQGNQPNEELLVSAQALSLVYSFNGEDVSDLQQGELARLGALIGKKATEMFRSAAELKRRDLLQQRGVWRAVLPHAIANRLAATALQDIPPSVIEAQLINGGSERLLKSFSRRLGYLDSSKEAQSLVRKWFHLDGILRNILDLNDLGLAILNYVAPVAPEQTVLALERALLSTDDTEAVARGRRHLSLLRSLAYDAEMFERCLALILKIAETEDIDGNANEASKMFASLFQIHVSGTHATIEQRLAVIESLLLSDDPKKRALGLMALRSALQTSSFSPGYNFEFGARSRDYGYWPGTRDDVKKWFGQTLRLAETFALSEQLVARHVRDIIAGQFQGLWTNGGMYDELEGVCCKIASKHFWAEGWIAIRETIHYDPKGFSPEISVRLASLELLLRPRDLLQRVRSMVLSEAIIYIGVDSTNDGTNDFGKIMAEVEVVARELGRAVSVDQDALAELLPELLEGKSQQMSSFGAGLAEGTEEPSAIWNQLVTHLVNTPAEKRTPYIFRGFLNALHTINPELANLLLDNALEHQTLAQWYPLMQTAFGIDKEGMERLMRSLDLGKAWIGIYRNLVGGGATDQILGPDFNRLLLRIAREPGGLDIAIEILCMRISFARTQSAESEILDVGCELIRQIRFTGRRDVGADYRLGVVAKNCLIGEKGAQIVREICCNLRDAVSKRETYAFHHGALLHTLLGAQPLAGLEALCGGDQADLQLGIRILDEAAQLRRNPFDAVPEVDLVSWCDHEPEIRYPAVAAGVTPFQCSSEGRHPRWTKIALKLLDEAPNRVAVLKEFIGKFSPSGWIGSHATVVESNVNLLDELAGYDDVALAEFVANEKIRLAKAIEAERHTEILVQREINERFE